MPPTPVLSETKTRYGMWRHNSITNTLSNMGKAFVNPNDGRIVSFPFSLAGTGYVQPISIDPETYMPLDIRFEQFGLGTGVAITSGMPYVQGDFTVSNVPGESPTWSTNTTYSFPQFIEARNEVWVVSATQLVGNYFRSTLEDPANVGFFDDAYWKWRARIFDLDTYTYTTTDLGLAQRSLTNYPAHPTLEYEAGSVSSSKYPIPSNNFGYGGGNLYFGWGTKKFATNGYAWLIVNVATSTGTIVDGYSPAGAEVSTRWANGGEAANGKLYCAPWEGTVGTTGFLEINPSNINSSAAAFFGHTNPISQGTSGAGSNGYHPFPAITDDGKVIFAPNRENSICVIDTTGSVTATEYGAGTMFANDTTTFKTGNCTFEGDGLVYIWPGTVGESGGFDYKTVKVFDPATNTFTQRFFGSSNFTHSRSVGYCLDQNYNFWGFVFGETSSGRYFMTGGMRNALTGTNEAIAPYPYNNQTLFSSPRKFVSNKHPVGMNFPFILLDTRNYTGANVMLNEGTGGRHWDMNIFTDNTILSTTPTDTVPVGVFRLFGEGLSTPLDDDIFGGPLQGKCFTVIVSFGAHNVGLDSNKYSFLEFYLGSSGLPFLTNPAYMSHNYRSSPVGYRTYISSFADFTGASVEENEAMYTEPSPLMPLFIPNGTVILTHDIQNGGSAVWVNGTKLGTNRVYNTHSGTDGGIPGVDDRLIYRNYPIVRNRIYSMRMFTYNGTWSRKGDIVKGFAMARGEPTEEEVAYWTTYWD